MKPLVLMLFITSAILAIWGIVIMLAPVFTRVFKPREQALSMHIKSYILFGFSGFFIIMALIADGEYIYTWSEWIKITLTLLLCCPGFGLLAGLLAFWSFKNHPFYHLDIDMKPKNRKK